MQTINNRMTETQIADLFSLAVQLQVKAEESDDRDTAILAYSIQNACSNLTESQREFRAADATIHNLELKLTDMAVQLANAESKCRELAAENAGLKAICEDRRTFIMNGVQLGYIKVPTVDTDPALDTIRVAVSPQAPTPATDAFMAEFRAQGVEQLAALAGNECQRYKSVDGRAGWRKWKGIVILCTDFASQLRKGVQS
ncbi:hypothetical protein RZR66_25645 [Citrobacter freundii]|uniref:hypothetical protein n=1 Tax=Citrobacter freundii TaxID=546 RepID=UPI00292B849F|nr:hypothetical protein [Citrobacter freundii]MDV2046276.1 hypothetical protein [Citrobacter freundii]MEB0334721.1 hypothetical protein [Citrobacter freundii]